MAGRTCALLAGCFAAASGMNLVNRKSKLCLDLHAPCVDGSEDENCQRMPVESLKKGTNLQLYRCNGKPNQEFELLANSRIRNPFTDLCIDIMAPCKDHFRTPCERLPVSELEGQANIQLYTCHEDKGVLSNSYGNQMWNFQGGQLKNHQSNLCLEPKLDSTGSMVEMSNVWAETCVEAEYQKFDFMEHAAMTETDSQAPGAVAPQAPAVTAPQIPAVVAPAAPLPVATPPAIVTPAPPPAVVTPAPPVLITPPPPVAPMVALPQEKFDVATSGSVTEGASSTQPMALLGVAGVGLFAAFARSAWRRAPTDDEGALISAE